jgi:hypothetical protein
MTSFSGIPTVVLAAPALSKQMLGSDTHIMSVCRADS